ncbi:helix-turn-helix domain-containing protein [Acinetobacter sp.]|uniref:helix-turn-helix domain-containing protein n=1 Tax=Acinetobacter sp. TaxID=472 RepID=UPI003D03795B
MAGIINVHTDDDKVLDIFYKGTKTAAEIAEIIKKIDLVSHEKDLVIKDYGYFEIDDAAPSVCRSCGSTHIIDMDEAFGRKPVVSAALPEGVTEVVKVIDPSDALGMSPDAKLDERMSYLRDKIGMSQEDLAKKTGLKLQTIQAYERGTHVINTMYKIAEGLGVSPSLLFSTRMPSDDTPVAKLLKEVMDAKISAPVSEAGDTTAAATSAKRKDIFTVNLDELFPAGSGTTAKSIKLPF